MAKKRSSFKRPTKEALVLRKIRSDRGISIRKAASRIGKSSSWLNHLESGRFDPRPIDLEIVAKGYGIKPIELGKIANSTTEIELTNFRAECLLIVTRMTDEKLQALYSMIKFMG